MSQKGTINGILLGFEKYLQTHRSGNQAVILNVSSVAGVKAMGCIPVYSSTKFAVHGLTVAWGTQPHYDRTMVVLNYFHSSIHLKYMI